MEFSFSTKIPSAPQAAELSKSALDDTLVMASVDGIATQVGQGQVLFQSQENGRTHVLDDNVLAILSGCRQFRPLRSHLAQLLHEYPQFRNDPSPLRKLLQNLLDLKLLIPAQTVLSRLSSAVSGIEPAPVAGAVIRTCDRPDQLRRLVDLLIRSPSRVIPNYLVMDDSRDAGHRRKNREIVRDGQKAKLVIRYLGLEWQNAFIESLAGAIPQQEEVLRYLCGPRKGAAFSGGRLNNLTALLCAGHRFVNLDDDMLPVGRVDAAAREPLLLAPRYDDAVHFYKNRDAAVEAGELQDEDLLGFHLARCGQSLGQVLRNASDAELKNYFLDDISRSGPDSRILSTMGGTYGNPRTGSNLWLYLLRGDARQAFLDFDQGGVDYMAMPHLWHTPRRPTLTPFPTFTATAMDGSVLIPPTLPTGRGEDYLFGNLLQATHPGSLSLASPVALGHLWPGPRDVTVNPCKALTLELPHFIAEFLTPCARQLRAAEATTRLQNLGGAVCDLAEGGVRNLRYLLMEYAMHVRGDLVRQLRNVAAESTDAPEAWNRDVQQLIDVNLASLVHSDRPDLGLWNRFLDDSRAREHLRMELGTFGISLQHWPALWEHCQGRLQEFLKLA